MPAVAAVKWQMLTHADKAILMPRDPDLVKAVNDWLTPAIAAGEPARVLESYLNH